jgi:hypothetical protein
MDKENDALLQQLVGELVWSVKGGYGTYLTMEFSTPHLVVREPIKSAAESERVRQALARRRVSIVGKFSLMVCDSQWSISTNGLTVDLNSSETAMREVFQNLDGQKVSAISHADGADTVLEFDLGGVVRLGKSIFPTEPTSTLWILQHFGNSSVGLLNDGSWDQ